MINYILIWSYLKFTIMTTSNPIVLQLLNKFCCDDTLLKDTLYTMVLVSIGNRKQINNEEKSFYIRAKSIAKHN